MPPTMGATMPPKLKPVVTMPKTRPTASGGEACRTSMSREGTMIPASRPAAPITSMVPVTPRFTAPMTQISSAAAKRPMPARVD